MGPLNAFGRLAVAAAFVFVPALCHAGDAPAGWQTDLFAARAASLESGKPMVVVIGAEWCRYCKKLESETLTHPVMATYLRENFVPVHLDFDANKPAAKALEIESIPATVVLSPQADLLGRVNGFQLSRDYWERLEDARELHAKVTTVSHAVPAE